MKEVRARAQVKMLSTNMVYLLEEEKGGKVIKSSVEVAEKANEGIVSMTSGFW